MKTCQFWLAAAGLFTIASAASATVEDEQLWLIGGGTVDLGDGFRVSGESNVRFGNAAKGLYEIESTLLLGYKLNKATTLWAGYTHDPLYSGGHFTRMERRFRQQVTFDNVTKIGTGSVSLRLRTEQRWRDNVSGTGWRVRPYVRYSLPVANKGRTTLQFGHESFINLSKTSFQSVTGYDRMRNNIALKFPLSKKLSAEIGYLNQYQFTRAAPDKMDHAATVSLSLSL